MITLWMSFRTQQCKGSLPAEFCIGALPNSRHVQGMSDALAPLGKYLGPLLAILDDVIQANLPKRKPKVAKGARDFGPREMTIRKPLFKASPLPCACT